MFTTAFMPASSTFRRAMSHISAADELLGLVYLNPAQQSINYEMCGENYE
jgi:hypothetical protein